MFNASTWVNVTNRSVTKRSEFVVQPWLHVDPLLIKVVQSSYRSFINVVHPVVHHRCSSLPIIVAVYRCCSFYCYSLVPCKLCRPRYRLLTWTVSSIKLFALVCSNRDIQTFVRRFVQVSSDPFNQSFNHYNSLSFQYPAIHMFSNPTPAADLLFQYSREAA
jgi:hypothetical protein